MTTTSGPSPTVSVIVCAYAEERWDQLERAVESAGRQLQARDELVVVVDHNERLLARCRDAWRDVRVLANTNPRGLSGARNRGVAAATGDVIAFLDDDAVPTDGWLDCLRLRFRDTAVMAVGGMVEPVWDRGRPSWFPDEFDWVVGCTFRGHAVGVQPVRNLIGANMSFRREVFGTAGRFREDLGRVGRVPAGCEETDLCIRAGRAWPERVILHDPAVRVLHHVPGHRSRWRYFLSRCYSEGQSKARLSGLVGTRDGLASERSYAAATLPRGIVRGFADGLLRSDLSGFLRAAAITVGLATTTAGFVRERLAAVAGATRGHTSTLAT